MGHAPAAHGGQGIVIAQFSYGNTPDDVIRRQVEHLQAQESPGKYRMHLNATDLLTVMHALHAYGNYTEHWPLDEVEDRDNAASLRLSILTTLGIEEI